MKKLLKISFAFFFLTQSVFSQSVEGTWKAVSAIVSYDYVARDVSTSPDDETNTSLTTTMSWPSSDQPLVTFPTKTFEVGELITTQLVPLVNPTLLQMLGIDINVDFNDDGNFTIIDGSTYPTTEEQNCSTYAVVPNVAENGTWASTTGFDHPDDLTKHSMGWGITQSEVFAQFSPADLVNGTLGVDYGPGTDMPNWGQITIGYNDEAHTTPTSLATYWEATDGSASGLGVDDDGLLNSFVGVPIAPADTVTIHNIEALLYATAPEYWASLGWTDGGYDPIAYPMIGGPGQTIDMENPLTYETDPFTGEISPAGIVDANHVYYFDPAGPDGGFLTGDEPFSSTGHFLTSNFAEASQIFAGVFDAVYAATSDLQTAATAAADSVAVLYVGADTSANLAASVGEGLYAEFAECFGTTGDADLCNAVFAQGPNNTLNLVNYTCQGDCGVDDSGWDVDLSHPDSAAYGGRLVLEVDNVCIRDITTQTVAVNWANTQFVNVDEDAPVSSEFKLHGNYPNPFNPSTKIKFSTEMLSNVSINVYSLIGEKVYSVDQGAMSAGTYDISWYGVDNAGNKVSSGVYFYEVRSNDRIARGKMLLMK